MPALDVSLPAQRPVEDAWQRGSGQRWLRSVYILSL